MSSKAGRNQAIADALASMETIQRLLGEAPIRAKAARSVSRGGRQPRGTNTFLVAPNLKTVREHWVSRTLEERQLVPPHGQRRSSKRYRATHDLLIKERHLPCIVCGVTDLTLAAPDQNPFGAEQIETHHRVVEWSLIKAVDLAKFNARVLPGLRRRSPTTELYEDDMTQEEMEDWADSHEDNMWVLCDVHHRHKLVGIHMISGPIWAPQDLLLERYQARG